MAWLVVSHTHRAGGGGHRRRVVALAQQQTYFDIRTIRTVRFAPALNAGPRAAQLAETVCGDREPDLHRLAVDGM